jgi:mannose/fructose/N-acetylgalactosamine-specific phosphotransferase system component IIC
VSLAQAALIAAGYWFTNSAFNANLGFNLLRWPLVAGMIAGWIMGDLEKGILIGAGINLVFLGSIWAGASQPSDPALAGWLGTAIVLSAGLGPIESVAIAAPLGFLPLLGMGNRMRVDVAFAHKAAAAAERGSIGGVAFWNWAPGQLYVLVTTFIPAFILALVGAVAIGGLYGTIDPGRGGSPDLRWVRDGLVIAGSLLMALGVGMNLSRMLSRATLPYFLIFFTVAALTHANIVALAVVAAALAFIHVSIFGRRSNV